MSTDRVALHTRIRRGRRQQASVTLRNGRLVRSEGRAEEAPPPRADAGEAPAIVDAPSRVGPVAKAFIVFFVFLLFLPNVYLVGPLALSPSLIFMSAAFLPVVALWAAGKADGWILSDWLILGLAIWSTVTRIMLIGVSAAVEPVGVHVLQTLVAYLLGRLLVRDIASTRTAFGTAVIGVWLMSLPLLIETVTGQKLLLGFASILGPTIAPTTMDPRWGFERAQGLFEHPILLGVFCASLVSISIYMFRGSRNYFVRFLTPPAVIVSAITSFSTGALLSMNIQFGLMLWGFLFRRVHKHWTILVYLLIAAYFTVDLLSNRTPFHVFVDYATFNSQSSYNRILIWQFGSAAVMQSPILGHGTDDWERPSYMSPSMDNFWLVNAYRYGLVGLALLAAACIIVLLRMSKRHGPSHQLDMMRRGAIFSMVGTMVAIVSVHLWNNSYVWFMFMLGAISWMSRPESAGEQSSSPEADVPAAPTPRKLPLRR